jgi:hypothetical protein
MSVNTLYATWFQLLTQLMPQERITRIRNLAWLVSGIALSHSVTLSRIAAALPHPVEVLSLVRRLERFLDNPAFQVRAWYEPYVAQLLQTPANQPLPLIIDSSRVGLNQQWLVVALAYRHRALPLAWDWVGYAKGHSTAEKQLTLLAYVRTLIPAGRPVVLVGDAEFGSMTVLETLETWGWQYVFRQKGKVLVRPTPTQPWQTLRSLVTQTRRLSYWSDWSVTRQHAQCMHLVTYWAQGTRQPWLLVTNLPSAAQALQAYRRRMWIEGLFGDVKGHGVHFEATQVRDPEKLSRLAFAVVLLYLGCIALGTHLRRGGKSKQVDRRSRRDLSLFQTGWRFVQRCVARDDPVSWRFNPFRYQTVG